VEPVEQPTDVWTSFAMSVFRINGLLILAGEDIVRPIGQSSARWQVLGRVFQPQTVSSLARDIGHARQSVQRITDILESEGLVAYRDNIEDRRAKLVELTPAGLKVLKAIYRRQVKWSDQLMRNLDPSQLRDIAGALEVIGHTIRAGIKGTNRRVS
jgi:DNA-binding MarR family transcriptional regulator